MICLTVSGKRRFLFFVTTLLLTEKTRSTAAEVAGIAKYRLAKTLKTGYLDEFAF
jgi:hypothetical protein